MGYDKIKVATSDPNLKNKIQFDVSPDSEDIYWYIRFNIPLDEESVSHDTMNVMDTEGYIMRTDIMYDNANNRIAISPIDSYEENIFYILNISTKVKSARGQYLRSKIHILFKLYGNKVSEFKVLKSNVQLPKPKPRPKNYEQKIAKTKLYSFDPATLLNPTGEMLKTVSLGGNVIIPILGILMLAVNIYFQLTALWIAGFAVCLIGAIILAIQLSRPSQRSKLYYNRGVKHFNKERYEKAEKMFKRAVDADEHNEQAEFALNKVSYYL